MVAEIKEIFVAVSAYGPRFLGDFIGMLGGPKRFLRKLDFRAKATLSYALTFALVGILINFLLELSQASGLNDLWLTVIRLIALNLFFSVITSAVLKLAFRMVGGRAPFTSYLIVSLYVTAPFSVIEGLLAGTSKGIVRAVDPALMERLAGMKKAIFTLSPTEDMADLAAVISKNPALEVAYALITIASLFACWWLYVTWGSYREINNISKWRSFLASVFYSIIVLPVIWLYMIMMTGMGIPLI